MSRILTKRKNRQFTLLTTITVMIKADVAKHMNAVAMMVKRRAVLAAALMQALVPAAVVAK